MVANISPTNPTGRHEHSAIRPPGLTTRASSAAATEWRGANMIPNVEIAASKLASSNGRSSASASTHSSSTPCCSARRRPGSNNSGVRSEATTSAPRMAAWIAALPLPAAMSSTRSPGPHPLASAATPPASQIHGTIASKSPAAHVARACCFIAAMSVMAEVSSNRRGRYKGDPRAGCSIAGALSIGGAASRGWVSYQRA